MLELFIPKIHIPRWSELPNIDLYMDQVLNYLNETIPEAFRPVLEEPCITKTMINNYVKHEIMAAPIKKKYTRLHIAELFVITCLKQVYTISDIQKLIQLALDTSPEDIAYNHFCDVLEDSFVSTFSGEEYTASFDLTEEQYLMKNVIQSFLNKLYVHYHFLKKDNGNA